MTRDLLLPHILLLLPHILLLLFAVLVLSCVTCSSRSCSSLRRALRHRRLALVKSLRLTSLFVLVVLFVLVLSFVALVLLLSFIALVVELFVLALLALVAVLVLVQDRRLRLLVVLAVSFVLGCEVGGAPAARLVGAVPRGRVRSGGWVVLPRRRPPPPWRGGDGPGPGSPWWGGPARGRVRGAPAGGGGDRSQGVPTRTPGGVWRAGVAWEERGPLRDAGER